MGLNAVVYVGEHKENECEPTEPASGHDTTGLTRTKAIHKRLGNVSMIASLRDEIMLLLDNDSLLLSKVLYSGSHSGDEIKVQDIDKLHSEIKTTRKKSGRNLSLAVQRFLDDMNDLVEKAKEEGSPIVFE